MAALPLNTAPHFVFFYGFCNFHDFYCALHQKNCFYHFQGHFVIIKEFFFKIQGQFKDKVHFFRIPGVFQDQGHFQGLFKVCANPVKGITTNQNFPATFCKQTPKVLKLFSCSTQLSMKIFLLINVKMPTTVGILTFMSRKIFMLS